MRQLFSKHGDALTGVVSKAHQTEVLLEAISPIIEALTSRLCPECAAVCCINRHSHFDYSDVIFMSALNRELPAEAPEVALTAPCRFLGLSGCLRKRTERPYRCTWYFCEPLLDVIWKQMPLPEYRRFMKMLREITVLRTEMINNFEAALIDLPTV